MVTERHRHRTPISACRGEWGKTGTTANSADAWFCGGDRCEVTACVWVGYADTTTPMATLYNGGPVMGGTFPALIWARVITAWEEIRPNEPAEKRANEQAASSPAAKANRRRSRRSRSTEAAEAEPTPCPGRSEANRRTGGASKNAAEAGGAGRTEPRRRRAGTLDAAPAAPAGAGGGVTAG